MDNARSNSIETAGRLLLRYGLVLVIGWIGAMKFTAYEAAGIQPLVASSPFMSWLYKVLSVQGVSNLIGSVELLAALLIAIRPLSAKLSAVGSILATGMFPHHDFVSIFAPGMGAYPRRFPRAFRERRVPAEGCRVAWRGGHDARGFPQRIGRLSSRIC